MSIDFRNQKAKQKKQILLNVMNIHEQLSQNYPSGWIRAGMGGAGGPHRYQGWWTHPAKKFKDFFSKGMLQATGHRNTFTARWGDVDEMQASTKTS